MCGSPSNIHLSPPSDPVKRIAVFNLLPLPWNEAEIYVMLPVGEMSCMKKQSRMPTHANRQFVGSGNEAGLCVRDCLRKRTVLPEFPVASGTSCSQRISCLSNVCLVNQQIASILQLPRHTLLWWPFCNFFVRSMRSESWHSIGNASSQSMDRVTAASKKLPKPPWMKTCARACALIGNYKNLCASMPSHLGGMQRKVSYTHARRFRTRCHARKVTARICA